MKNPIIIIIIISVSVFAFLFGMEYNDGDHASWSRGYTECMNDVVVALASCDEVRMGNLIINKPNTTISDMVFFFVDPNMYAVACYKTLNHPIDVNAPNVTFMNGTYRALCGN